MVDYRSFFFGAALGAARSPRGRRFTGNTLVFCSDVPDRGAHEYRVRVDSEENYLRADMRVRGPNDLERGTRYRSTNPAIMQQPCYPWLTWSYLVRSLSQSVGYHIFAGDVWDVEPHRNDLYDDRQAVVTAIIPDVLRTPDFRTGGAVHMAEHIRQMSPLAFERLVRAADKFARCPCDRTLMTTPRDGPRRRSSIRCRRSSSIRPS